MSSRVDSFLELELDDIRRRLEDLFSSGGKLKLWSEDQSEFIVGVTEVTSDIFRLKESVEAKENQLFFATFVINNLKYYLRGEICLSNSFKIKSAIYRAEKRGAIRYLMHTMNSASIKFDGISVSQDMDNVLSINTFRSKDENVFRDFEKSIEKLTKEDEIIF